MGLTNNRLIILGVLVTVIIFGVIFFTISSSNSSPKKSPEPTPNPSSSNIAGQDFQKSTETPKLIPPVNSSELIGKITPNYRVAYPQNWQLEYRNIVGGGTQFLLTIPSSEAKNATVIIQEMNSSNYSKSQAESGYRSLKYQESDNFISVDGNSADKFTGAIETTNGSLRQQALVFQKNDTIYTAILSYVSNTENKDLEDAFFKTINSMRFN